MSQFFEVIKFTICKKIVMGCINLTNKSECTVLQSVLKAFAVQRPTTFINEHYQVIYITDLISRLNNCTLNFGLSSVIFYGRAT